MIGGRTARLYVWGTLDYTDAFGATHWTNFCHEYWDIGQGTDVRFAPCVAHNDTDPG
jgi:hypothetical protein